MLLFVDIKRCPCVSPFFSSLLLEANRTPAQSFTFLLDFVCKTVRAEIMGSSEWSWVINVRLLSISTGHISRLKSYTKDLYQRRSKLQISTKFIQIGTSQFMSTFNVNFYSDILLHMSLVFESFDVNFWFKI